MGAIEKVDLGDLDLSDLTYCSSLDRDTGPLLSSVERVGLIVPPRVQERDGRLVIVSGFLRVQAAVRLSMKILPVHITTQSDPVETLLSSLHENRFTRGFSWIERTWVLERALEWFRVPEQWAIDELLPAMGLEPAKEILRQHMVAASIPLDVRRKLALLGCSLANAIRIASLEKEDQMVLADFLTSSHMSESMLRECIELLKEIAMRDGLRVRDILCSPQVKGALERAEGDRVQRGKALREQLLRWRMPRWTELRDRFERAKGRLKLPRGVSVKTSPFFETKGVTVTFEARSPQEFVEIVEKLKNASSHWEALRELFSALDGS